MARKKTSTKAIEETEAKQEKAASTFEAAEDAKEAEKPADAAPAEAEEHDSKESKAEELYEKSKHIWEKAIDKQKSVTDSAKKQYDSWFSGMLEWEEDLEDFLPDDDFDIFGFEPFMTPVEALGCFMEFQKLANDCFVKQCKAWNDFAIAGQRHALKHMPQHEAGDEK